jgi:hypothetical protein
MQRAIEKREGALINAYDNYYVSVRSTMIIRKDALKNAWTFSDSQQRKDAVRNAGRAFVDAEKSARRTKRDADKAAARTYKTDAEECEIDS